MLALLEINNNCSKCDSCRQICPENAILTNGESYSIDTWACSDCEICKVICPDNAIKRQKNSDS